MTMRATKDATMTETSRERLCDKVVRLPCGSLIQHGDFNKRIYLMRPGENCPDDMPERLVHMAREHGYTKIFAKVPYSMAEMFIARSFAVEAAIPGFYNGNETGVFLGYWLDSDRFCESEANTYEDSIKLALDKGKDLCGKNSKSFQFRLCNGDDVFEMAELYRVVFDSYPFPIFDPAYLSRTMNENVDYFCAETDGRIVALSSAERDDSAANAEMTDFATHPDWRGKGLAACLLERMEAILVQKKIHTAYTIARASSPGMNITFSRMGYTFAGRLRNNTNIAGGIESMNVWYRKLM